MPSSVADLISGCGLEPKPPILWPYPISHTGAGIFLVALTEDPYERHGGYERCPCNPQFLDLWLHHRPELRMDGRRPTVARLAKRLNRFWLPDEGVVYIGAASGGLCYTVQDMYQTEQGSGGPHPDPGISWLQVLDGATDLWVHHAPTSEPQWAWRRMLDLFCEDASPAARARFGNAARVLPYANLAGPDGVAKPHGVTHMTDASDDE